MSSATKRAIGAASRRSTSSSGFARAAGSSCNDHAAGATSRTSASSSGLASAAAALDADHAAGATSGTSMPSSGSASVAGLREGSNLDLSNPWNRFQHEHAGQGFSKKTLSRLYQFYKKKDH